MAQPAKKPSFLPAGSFQAVVEKRSSSNMFYNKRSISIAQGVISYYSKAYPPTTDLSTVRPKASLLVNDITMLDIPPKPNKPNSVVLSFPTRCMVVVHKQEWEHQHRELRRCATTVNSSRASSISSV
jgi:hypothetical protein